MSVLLSKSKAQFCWWQWLSLLAGLVLIALSLFVWQAYSSYRTFLAVAGLDDQGLQSLLRQAELTTVPNHEGQTTFLVLGTDTLVTRPDGIPLTDTVMVANSVPSEGRVNLLSLPRDLVLPGEVQRINTVYAHFNLQASGEARLKTREYLAQKFGLPLDYVVVVTMDQVREFIDLIGGVDVDVKRSFTDYQYPRDNVDVSAVHDPASLYETVTFEVGMTHLDGRRALQFMRSRHAQNEEGSDFARSARQQQVIEAVVAKVGMQLRRDLSQYDLTLLGKFYRFYQEKFEDQVPFVDGLGLALDFLQREQLPEVKSGSLSVDAPGAVLHEDKSDYTLHASSLSALQFAIKQQLGFVEQVSDNLN